VRDRADFGVWEEHHRELLREAEHRRLARGLREARKKVRAELPAGGWRRAFGLLGVLAVPFFGAFSAKR
jgi:hypothetical protein